MDFFLELSDEELNERLQLLTHTNEILALENEVFERYLHRNDLQSLVREFSFNIINL